MRKKCNILALCSFIIAVVILVITYFVFHYMGDDCRFSTVFNEEPAKPFVTFLLGMWGVMHHFAAVMCLLIGQIFFPKSKPDSNESAS